MKENLNYSLTCIIEDAKEQKVEINWTDENGKLLQKGGDEYSFTADHRDNGNKVKCRVHNNDFVVEDVITLKVNYQPRFVNKQNQSSLQLFYGSKITFDCLTIENPKKNSSKWLFTHKNSNKTQTVMDYSNDTLSISELLEEHEGLYECIVTNDVGEVRREFSIVLLPKEPPKVATKNIIIAKEGEDVELFCECRDCLPLANFTWTYDNIGSYEKFFIKNQEENIFKTIMKLSNVDENDNGTFYCSMWNELGEDEVAIDLLVQTSPKIDGIILNNEDYDEERVAEVDEKFEVLEGKNFSVECIVADSYPEPSIYWMRNNEKITNESVLTIESVLVSDEGNYECFAENDLGVTKKGFHVDVNYPPRRKREVDTSYEVPKDNDVTLKCELIGNPPPKISWKLNSKEIMSNEKYKVEENYLKFMASADDSGIYKCNGTNKFGHSTIDFSVIVMNPPQILDPNDESLKIKTNSTLKLLCDATGYPLPKITFLRNKNIVSNESHFEIKAVTQSDSGSYNCIAENQIGQIEKIFYVSVVEEAKIISVFENLTIINNNSIELNCSATGLPKPIISWRHDDKEIGNSTDSLLLDHSYNSGKISCYAQNSEGSDEKYFYVDVVKMPIILPAATTVDKEIKLKENDNLELLCPFENFNDLVWSLNGHNLNSSEYKELDGKIFITHVNRRHNGTWDCTVSNVAGQETFSYAVNVLMPPKIFASWNLNDSITDFLYSETDIDEKVLKKGEKLILNCTVDGSPLPKIQWRKGTDLFGEGEILSIDNLHFHHSDIYSCIAENSQGIVKKFFKVDVTSAPYIDDTISLQTKFQKMIGDSVILKCNSIIANPSPLHFWFKDNELLDDEADDTMIIEHLKATDSGKYRCLAKNKLGSAKIEYEISIYQPSKILTINEESTANEDSLILSCTSKGNPLPIIAWTLNGHILSTTSKMNVEKLLRPENDNRIYFDGYGNGMSLLDPFQLKVSRNKFYSKLLKIDSNTLKLDLIFKNKKNLHLNKYICYSFNGLGKDEKSIKVTIKQKPHLETQNIFKTSDYEILEQMPLLLNCPIQGYPQPQINWFKNGLKVYENETVEFLKDQQFLRISEANSWNSGNYSCIAKNEEGESELIFNVLVLSPPKILRQPNANYLNDENRDNSNHNENEERIDVLKGSNVILECTVEASPKAKIHWVKLNFYDSFKGNELLKTEENFLALNSLQESSSFMCYANNTIGNIQKFFFINVQYPPTLSENGKSEEYLTVKLHHSVNLECHIKASPEAITYWSFNSTNLTKSNVDYYFSTDNQIMRITNANRNHEGKYLCNSVNNLGWIQKVFYVKLEIPIQYSPWSQWSDCSSSCGSNGVQYRSRTCVLLDAVPSYNCSGENVQARKCNDIPCPINGGWSDWVEWSECPACYDTQLKKKSKQKRYRKCDNPFPAYGGLNCDGNNEEEKDCKLSPCPVDGKWSDWSNWSLCSKTCGKGLKTRKRFCNKPSPMHNGKPCDGENYEVEECKIRPCSNYGMLKSLNNRYDSTERYEEFSDFGLMNDQNGKPKMYQYMQHREMEYSPPVQDRGLKVKITLDTYKPISAETYNSHINNLKPNVDEDIDQIEDYFETESLESIESTEATLRVTTERNCGQGFKYNQVYRQCEEVDECKSKELNSCMSNERCINTIGSYRCEKLYN
ncbi:unnamed protein product [Chironomus riparius]|uniref:Ig-like domain-containing protein n=1 Tax=Chironomus riparius TaxID=315576 RepID=A0A9N9RWA6_9DIPT|nr:unnamed protein product [Chironomus riparius]